MVYEKSNVRILQQKEGQFFLTVPAHLAASKEWKKGDPIKFLINDKGRLELVKE
jgi:hypothetical protein